MKKFFILTAILFPTITHASEQTYNLIINTTDTSTQLHIFRIEKTADLPKITDLYTLSSPASLIKPDAPLKNLLDNAMKKFTELKLNPVDVPINILGTENMRSLPIETQNKIYLAATQFIQNNYPFTVQSAESITGKMEGVYSWLDVNYSTANFANNFGILHVGKTSTLIAYAIPASAKPEDEVNLTLQGHHHTLLSKNFSTLGEDTSRFAIHNDALEYTCYPIEFPLFHDKGNFQQQRCKDIYTNFVEEFHLLNQITPISNQNFVVFGDANNIYQFLGVEDPDQRSYEARLYYACTTTWKMMKAEYDNIPETELANICADAVFVDQVIYQGFSLRGSQLWVTDRIDSQTVDWPLGYVLYNTLQGKVDSKISS